MTSFHSKKLLCPCDHIVVRRQLLDSVACSSLRDASSTQTFGGESALGVHSRIRHIDERADHAKPSLDRGSNDAIFSQIVALNQSVVEVPVFEPWRLRVEEIHGRASHVRVEVVMLPVRVAAGVTFERPLSAHQEVVMGTHPAGAIVRVDIHLHVVVVNLLRGMNMSSMDPQYNQGEIEASE